MNDRTALYRHYNSVGELLYVGISLSAIHRFTQHQRSSIWVIDAVRMDTQWFESRLDAVIAEQIAIKTELPLFNISHSLTNMPKKNIKNLEEFKTSSLNIYCGIDEYGDVFVYFTNNIMTALNNNLKHTTKIIKDALDAYQKHLLNKLTPFQRQ